MMDKAAGIAGHRTCSARLEAGCLAQTLPDCQLWRGNACPWSVVRGPLEQPQRPGRQRTGPAAGACQARRP